MPIESIKVVSEWAKNNPNFQVWLWIDKKTAEKGDNHEEKKENLLKKYMGPFSKFEKNIYLNEESAQCHDKQSGAPIILKDITEESVCSPNVRNEIDKLVPNYGSSSDLLRYKILQIFGGAYFDSDVSPGENSLEESSIFFNQHTFHFLYVDHLSQRSISSAEGDNDIIEEVQNGLKKFELESIGNDSFICSKSNPLMKLINDNSEKSYESVFVEDGRALYEHVFHLETMVPNSDDLKKYNSSYIVCGKELFYINSDNKSNIVNISNTEIFLSGLNKFGKKDDQKICLSHTDFKRLITLNGGHINPDMLMFCINLAYGSNNIEDTTVKKTGPECVEKILSDEAYGKIEEIEKNGSSVFTKMISGQMNEICPLRCTQMKLSEPLSNTRNWINTTPIACDSEEEAFEKSIATIEFEMKNFYIIRLEDHVRQVLQSLKISPEDIQKTSQVTKLFLDKLESRNLDYSNIVCAQYLSTLEILQFYTKCNLKDKTFFAIEVFYMIIDSAMSRDFFITIKKFCENEELESGYSNTFIKQMLLYINIGLSFSEKACENNLLDERSILKCKNNLSLYGKILESIKKYNDLIADFNELNKKIFYLSDLLTKRQPDEDLGDIGNLNFTIN